MTLPRNFTGRVNERRRTALDRIERQIASGVKNNGNDVQPLTDHDFNRLSREANTLGLRVLPDARARGVRTKKNRTGTGKLTRLA